MTTELVINRSVLETLIGWLAQMWPIMAAMAGGFFGTVKFFLKKHNDCQIELAVTKEDLRHVTGQVDVLVRLFGQNIQDAAK